MLHIPGDRAALGEAARRAEAWAEENAGTLAEHLRGARRPVVAYGAGGLPAAHALHLASTLLLGVEPILLSADEATYHLLPYREDLRVVLFSARHGDSSAYRLLEAARLVGHEALAAMPPPPQALEERMAPHTLLKLPPDTPPQLAQAMLALKAAYRLAPRTRGRVERLELEVGSLAEIHGELEERYGEAAREILAAAGEPITLAYTPSMKGPAHVAAERITEATGRRPPLAEASELASTLLPGERAALLYTTVEEQAARLLRSRAARLGARLVEIGLNTDPLTAQIYGIMIAEMIRP